MLFVVVYCDTHCPCCAIDVNMMLMKCLKKRHVEIRRPTCYLTFLVIIDTLIVSGLLLDFLKMLCACFDALSIVFKELKNRKETLKSCTLPLYFPALFSSVAQLRGIYPRACFSTAAALPPPLRVYPSAEPVRHSRNTRIWRPATNPDFTSTVGRSFRVCVNKSLYCSYKSFVCRVRGGLGVGVCVVYGSPWLTSTSST